MSRRSKNHKIRKDRINRVKPWIWRSSKRIQAIEEGDTLNESEKVSKEENGFQNRQLEAKQSMTFLEFVKSLCLGKEIFNTCQHYFVNPGHFHLLLYGKLDVLSAHGSGEWGFLRNTGSLWEREARMIYEKVVDCPLVVPSCLPFLCTSPSFVGMRKGLPILCEVGAFEGEDRLKRIVRDKSVYLRILLAMEVFHYDRAHFLLFKKGKTVSLRKIIEVKKEVSLFDLEGVTCTIICNYISFLAQNFSIFFERPSSTEEAQAASQLFDNFKRFRDTVSARLVEPTNIGPCRFLCMHSAMTERFRRKNQFFPGQSTLISSDIPKTATAYTSKLASASGLKFTGIQPINKNQSLPKYVSLPLLKPYRHPDLQINQETLVSQNLVREPDMKITFDKINAENLFIAQKPMIFK